MANTKLPARLLDTSAVPALNVTGDLIVDTTTLKVDSSNNRVGIGVASPSHLLDLRSTTSPILNIQGADGNSKNIYFRKNTGDTVEGRIKVYADIMSFETGGSEKIRIDSSGKVGIGTGADSPSAKLEVRGANGAYSGGILLSAGSSVSEATALYHDNSSYTTTVLANRYGSANAAIKLRLQDASGSPVDALTALGSGAVSVGSSITATGGFLGGTNGGIRIHSGGTKFFNITAANAARDGIMDIGAADARFKDLYLSGDVTAAKIKSGSNLHFNQNGNSASTSINFTGTTFKPFDSNDNTLDLGTSGARWKDLYLSGGVNFSANASSSISGTSTTSEILDDYEEGTWTGVIGTSDGQFTTAGTTSNSRYTKIGNQVTVWADLSITTPNSGTGTVRVTGLPYASESTGFGMTSQLLAGRFGQSSTYNVVGYQGTNSTTITFYYLRDNNTLAGWGAAQLNNTTTPYIGFTMTYTTAS